MSSITKPPYIRGLVFELLDQSFGGWDDLTTLAIFDRVWVFSPALSQWAVTGKGPMTFPFARLCSLVHIREKSKVTVVTHLPGAPDIQVIYMC